MLDAFHPATQADCTLAFPRRSFASSFLGRLAPSHFSPESDLYLPTELKSLLTTYISSHSLSHPRDQKFIKLDPLLQEILLKKGESVDLLTKEDANKRLRDGCTAWWSMERRGEEKVVM